MPTTITLCKDEEGGMDETDADFEKRVGANAIDCPKYLSGGTFIRFLRNISKLRDLDLSLGALCGRFPLK
jgi:hypothetical protein